MTKASRPYKQELLKALQDPEEAVAYLNAALEESSNEIFLMALRNVAEAHGITRLAKQADLNRESMYRILSEQGNPQLSSLTAILEQLGLKLSVAVKDCATV
ncbi:addiction module antidote protein [Synechococcus sp. PCC 7336]|uniref:addiction module antidote protein n=1 Tax=Synechococcus sp. PCC 7336 TaxID=195250 RepID=UPI00035C1E8A|nr:addiction module antidote protein [Synechococcus sp. PCC 7336]